MKIWFSEKLGKIKPRLAIGIGPCTMSAVPSIAIIERTCLDMFPGIPIIYGGPLASIPGLEWFFFEYLHADAVISGDAELVLADLLTVFRSKENVHVEGVFLDSTRKFVPNIIRDLNKLPFPARDLVNLNYYFPSIRRDLFAFPFATMICSRGCPFNCGFCASPIIRKGIQTKRSLKNISEEIRILSEDVGIRSVIFYDDSFFSNKASVNEEIEAFSKAIEAVSPNIVWQVEMRPDIGSFLTEKTIKTMYKSGCRQVNFGIEKGTEKGLRSLEKNLHPDQAIEACRRIAKASPKLRLTGTFILGGPGETYEGAMETIEFATRLNLLFAHFYPLEIYPGTRLYQQKFGSDMRVWLEKIVDEPTFVGSLVYEDCLDRKDLIRLVRDAYITFYRRKEWISLAQKLLGNHFKDVSSVVFSWGEKVSRSG